MNALREYEIFKVISHNDLDGLHVDHFRDLTEAREFARNAAEEGFNCIVCRVCEAFEADDAPVDYGVTAGVDYPATLGGTV